MYMILSKHKTLLLPVFAILFHGSISWNCNLIASEIVNCENKDIVCEQKNWFDAQLIGGLRESIDVFFTSNSTAPKDEWFEKALVDKQDKFYESAENLKDLILLNKAVLCKTEQGKKQYHEKRKSAFLQSIKDAFERDFDRIKSISSGDSHKSEENAYILGLINGFVVDSTLWCCFNEEPYKAKFPGQTCGLNNNECFTLCYRILSDIKQILSGDDFTIKGMSLWQKLGGKDNTADLFEDSLVGVLAHDWNCYLLGTLTIAGRHKRPDEMGYWSSLVDDVNLCCKWLFNSYLHGVCNLLRSQIPQYNTITNNEQLFEKLSCQDKDFLLYFDCVNDIMKHHNTNCKSIYATKKILVTKSLFDKTNENHYCMNEKYSKLIYDYITIKTFVNKHGLDYSKTINDWHDLMKKEQKLYEDFEALCEGCNNYSLGHLASTIERINDKLNDPSCHVKITQDTLNTITLIEKKLRSCTYNNGNESKKIDNLYTGKLAVALYNDCIGVDDFIARLKNKEVSAYEYLEHHK